jgi:hypothetical protein
VRALVKLEQRAFIRRLLAIGLAVESTPGHYRLLRDGELIRRGWAVCLRLRARRAPRCVAASAAAVPSQRARARTTNQCTA